MAPHEQLQPPIPTTASLMLAPFRRISVFAEELRTARTRLFQMEELQAKSDRQLSALGLSRDRIARHLFRDLLAQ